LDRLQLKGTPRRESLGVEDKPKGRRSSESKNTVPTYLHPCVAIVRACVQTNARRKIREGREGDEDCSHNGLHLDEKIIGILFLIKTSLNADF
jgi:hypothetical protein